MIRLDLLLQDIEYDGIAMPSYVSYYNIIYEGDLVGRLKTRGDSHHKPVIGEVARLRGSAMPDFILLWIEVQFGCPVDKVNAISLPTDIFKLSKLVIPAVILLLIISFFL